MDAVSTKPLTAGEWVTDVLRQEILDGQLRPGEAIRQEEIAGRLNVSRMPVREAIRRLAAEGWVEDRPNRMALVMSLDPDDAREPSQSAASSNVLRSGDPSRSSRRKIWQRSAARTKRCQHRMATTRPAIANSIWPSTAAPARACYR